MQYFHDHSANDEPNVQSETNRYIAWPGQALAYKMGQLKILELRETRPEGNWSAIRHPRNSTTRCSAPARCRSTSSGARIDDWIAQQKGMKKGA